MGDVEIRRSPKLPITGKRNILITSALPYVNNVPHLGNIIGCVLSADVFARYCRLRGYNPLYICGTDEYGTTTETKAMEENCSPREICDKYHAIHREVYEWFDISFDEFGRTSSPQHTLLCQQIFKQLLENEWLTEKSMEQLYCDTCEKFLADRLVVGVCPGCGDGSAKGDQCDNCSKILNPTELQHPRCKVCQTTPHIRSTDHFFLELPKLKNKLEEHININEAVAARCWSPNAVQATRAFLRGLVPRCITRDLRWGVPVPHERFMDKVLYVWFDAPIAYASITSCYTHEWEKWWKNPNEVELYQFMGKDNVAFHSVMFPSTLLGTNEEWTLVKTISATEYLNFESGKFSKSRCVGVFGNDAKDTSIPASVWRYYLLAIRPEGSDTVFQWSDLQSKVNNDLNDKLGNFINRVLSFIAKPKGRGYESVVPDAPGAESHLITARIAEQVGLEVERYVEAMEKVKLREALKSVSSIWNIGNEYITETKFWSLYEKDPPSCSIVMKTSVGIVYVLACLLEPFMPSISVEIFKQLNLPAETEGSLSADNGILDKAKRPWEIVPAGHRLGTPQPLFHKLEDDQVDLLKTKFKGSQAD